MPLSSGKSPTREFGQGPGTLWYAHGSKHGENLDLRLLSLQTKKDEESVHEGFGDFFKQKTAHNSVCFFAFSWGDPSFAEVKNSSSFKKQAPIFFEQKTWDFPRSFQNWAPQNQEENL